MGGGTGHERFEGEELFDVRSPPVNDVLDRLGIEAGALDGQVALVTGGARGIGSQAARGLAHLGAAVVIVDQREIGAEVEREIVAAGGRALFIHGDINDQGLLAESARRAGLEFGPVDILLNNAVEFEVHSVLELSMDSWDRLHSTNVRSALVAMKTVLPRMLERRSGVITNMIAPTGIAYAADMSSSKAALRSLMVSLAAEVGVDSGVAVFGFLPGLVATELVRENFPRYAGRLGVSFRDYVLSLRPNLGYPGLQPAEHCAASLLHAIVHASDHHGFVADGYRPLLDRGIIEATAAETDATIELNASLRVENIDRLRNEVREAVSLNAELDRLVRHRTRALQREVAERRAAQAKAEQLAAVVEGSNDAIVTTSTDGVFTSWNRAAERLFGYAASEAIGMHASKLVPAELADEQHSQLKKLAVGELPETYDTVRLAKDGSPVDVRISLSSLRDPAGAIEGFAANIRDIRARRAAERELEVVQEHLRQAAKMAAMGQLAGGVAHDFNNMLTVIESATTALRESLGEDHPNALDLQDLKEAAQRTGALTKQLLAFSRKQPSRRAVVDVREVLDSMRRMLARSLRADIEISVDLGSDACCVLIDRAQLEQMLLNFAVNARDAMDGGGRLSFATRVASREGDDRLSSLDLGRGSYAVISVSDTGHGMSPNLAARVFEPFFTTKDVGRGSGMGLAMVYGLVRGLGGAITVDSETGVGTTFTVWLPLADGEAVAVATEPTDLADAGPHTILLVEDEDMVRRGTQRMLERHGYSVLAANGAGEAQALVDQHHHVDLILTDVVMPDTSGPKLVEQLACSLPGARVLFMSGYTYGRTSRQSTEVSPLLTKPFTRQQLLEAVQRVLADDARLPSMADGSSH